MEHFCQGFANKQTPAVITSFSERKPKNITQAVKQITRTREWRLPHKHKLHLHNREVTGKTATTDQQLSIKSCFFFTATGHKLVCDMEI